MTAYGYFSKLIWSLRKLFENPSAHTAVRVRQLSFEHYYLNGEHDQMLEPHFWQ